MLYYKLKVPRGHTPYNIATVTSFQRKIHARGYFGSRCRGAFAFSIIHNLLVYHSLRFSAHGHFDRTCDLAHMGALPRM